MGSPQGDLPATEAVEAVMANWADLYAHLGRSPMAELSIGPHLSWLVTGVPDPFLNAVFRTDLPADGAQEIVDGALRGFRSKRVTHLSWWAGMAGTDASSYLLARGLSFDDEGTAMAADLRSLEDAPNPADLEIVPVEDPTRLRSFIQVMSVGFGIAASAERQLFDLLAPVALEPPLTCYLGMLSGRPVATSQLFLSAGVAGIYSVTCLPEARGRGIGSALTRAPMLDARQLGYRLGILQASHLGYPIYRKLGFEDLGRIPTYRYIA